MPAKKSFLPFETARAIVAVQGFSTQSDFHGWAERPANIPSNPRANYSTEWSGWAYWLGTGPATESGPSKRQANLPFEEARTLAHRLIQANGIESQEQWFVWAKANARHHCLPVDPYSYYKDSGWTNWPDWFGRTPSRATGREPAKPFHEAREYARSLGLQSCREFKSWAATDARPSDIPRSPEQRYRCEGWMGWGDFLGHHSRWTHQGIVAFLESLKPVVGMLSELEMYLILSCNGMLGRDRRLRGGKILRSLTRLASVEDIDRKKEELATELLQEAEGGTPPVGEGLESSVATLDDLDLVNDSRLRSLKSLDVLRAMDLLDEHRILDDESVLEFMVRTRIGQLWQDVISGDESQVVSTIRATTGGRRLELTRDRFLTEYESVVSAPIPREYDFRSATGAILPPNLMQRLTAYKVANERHLGNWSGVGAGKTVAAVLSAVTIPAELTIVIAANATVQGWRDAILKTLPGAHVHVKAIGKFSPVKGKQNFLVLNYETFQQDWCERLVERVRGGERVDLLVFDEIQLVRQRHEGENWRSKRRANVEALVQASRITNPEVRTLGMSATPVVNNLREAVKLLELIVPDGDFSNVPVGASVANAVGVHLLLQQHGIRYRPVYTTKANQSEPVLDGGELLNELMGVSARDLLKMEQVLLQVKLKALHRWVRRGTMIYTHFVEGIVPKIQEAVERQGLSVRLFTGKSRVELTTFLADFREGRADVLIGSAPIGTGVDGLQHHLDRLVFLTLPWSNAEYQQIVGRLHRQGSAFQAVEVIIPQVVLREERAGIWSWDDSRLRCIEYKRTLADAAVDGVIPAGGLPSREELQARSLLALEKWVERYVASTPLADSKDQTLGPPASGIE